MRIATRLVLALVLTTTSVMVIYGVVALDQRGDLLRDALGRETETLARSAQIVANNALRDGRLEDLDRVLGRIAEDPLTLVAAVVGEDGGVLAGGPTRSLTCLRAAPAFLPAMENARLREAQSLSGWVECDGAARWVALPVQAPGARVVLGRRATVVEQDLASSRLRILWTTLVLAAAAAAAILLVLRRTLSEPLSQVMAGVRTLGGPNPPASITVPRSAGELGDLAVAFNEMAERLEGKRDALVQEAEERVDLERRLRSAEKFAAVGQLSGGLAHELGSPLNVISVRAEAIEASPDVPPPVRRQAEEILVEIDRIAAMVRGLRHVAGGHPIDPRPVDLADVVAAVARDVDERARTARVSLRVQAAGPVIVPGDPTLLRHAVANLARNAIQAAAEQPGERFVWLRAEDEGAGGRVVVEDSGPGIPSEVQPRLFEPFFTTRDVGEGMGLGLAISRGIAEEHGGVLRLANRAEGGVRATLWLPARTGTEAST